MATYTMDKFTYGGNTYVLQDSGALQLTGGNVTGPVNFGDSVSMDDLTTGQLIVTGNASFTNNINANTINGVVVGSTPQFTDTTYTAGTGLTLTNGQFKHSNSVTAGTAGTSSATSGSTLAVPYITYDAQGHITGSGTHTHTISGFLTSSSTLDASKLSGAIPSVVTATTQTAGDSSTKLATTEFVGTAVSNAVSGLTGPMVFKGTVGTNGTITSLPTAAASNKGYTYKVITALSSPSAKVGDVVISDGSSWIVVPSGDEPSGTVTNVATGTGLTGGPITDTGTISLATITKSNSTSTASPSHGGTFTAVDSVTYDNYGRVTGVNTKTVTLPSDSNTHYTANLITGASATATANAANTTTNSIFLNLIENSTVRNSHNIVGSGGTTVSCDANGKITISSTDTNTDTKVTQAYSTTNSNYPLLMTATSGVSSTATRGDTTAILNNSLYANPSTGAIYSKKLIGSDTELIIASDIIRLRNKSENNFAAGTSYPYVTQLKMGDGDYILFSEYNDDDLSIRGSSILLTTRTQPPVYSASSTYSVGAYVWYNQQYYKCTTAITTAEAWNASHWTAMPISAIMADANLNPWITETYSLGTSSYKWSDVQTQKINGTNVPSLTAQTTQAVYPIKINANGMITGYGSAVTIPTIPSNNVTGSGTNGYLVKWTGTNTVGDGPQIGTGTTKFLREDGTWQTPAYTTNTDEKVKQLAAITTNGAYPIILAYSTGTTEVTNTVNKTSTLTYNPNTSELSINSVKIKQATTGFTIAGGSSTSKTLTISESYTLGAACEKAVTDSTSASAISTGTSLPTERDIYYGLPTINNSHSYTSSTTIYAPTAGGTSGYYLKGAGTTTAPTWQAPSDSSSASAISTGTSLVTERDVYYGLPSINGVHTYTSSTSIYAPTSAGTSGYILQSNGSGAPSWVSAQLTDTVTTVTASGTGNVVTGMTASNGAITYTMGTVSTTAAQIIRW